MTTTASQEIYGKAYGGNAAENYERFFVPAIGAPLANDLIAMAQLRLGERVLDVACGTGIVARRAAERVGTSGSVAGVDLTAAMLTVARAVATAASVPIHWYETSAEAMPLPDDAFDVVFCQLGLQFVADKEAALGEMRRVLAPGGRVFVSVPGPSPFFEVLHDAFARHGAASAAAFVHLVFSLHDQREVERLFRRAGFSAVETRSDDKQLRLPQPLEFFWQYVQSTPLAAALGQDDQLRAAMERDVPAAWQPWVEDDHMTYSQPVLIASGRKEE